MFWVDFSVPCLVITVTSFFLFSCYMLMNILKHFFVVNFIVSPTDEPRPMVWEVVEQIQVVQRLCVFPETQLSWWFCAFFFCLRTIIYDFQNPLFWSTVSVHVMWSVLSSC